MGWLKLPVVLSSSESQPIPLETKYFLTRPTVPGYEICAVRPRYFFADDILIMLDQHIPPSFLTYVAKPGESFLGAIALVMNPQSCGTVTLQSSDPSAPPHIDPEFLTHAFDCRVIIEGVRQTMKILSAPVYAGRTIEKFGPAGDLDEEIWVSYFTRVI